MKIKRVKECARDPGWICVQQVKYDQYERAAGKSMTIIDSFSFTCTSVHIVQTIMYYYVSFQYERKSNHIKYESFFPFPKILFINSYKIFFCCIVYIRILIIIFMNICLY